MRNPMPWMILACLPLLATGAPPGINLDELRAANRAAFERADIDGDGMITSHEFEQQGGPARSATIALSSSTLIAAPVSADTAGTAPPATAHDQAVPVGRARSIAHRIDPDAIFDAMDTDGDGYLSREEFRERPMPRGMALAGAAPIALTPGMPPEQAVQRAFAGLDGNGDGVITFDEWPSHADRLAEADANGDGIVTHREMVEHGPGRLAIPVEGVRPAHR